MSGSGVLHGDRFRMHKRRHRRIIRRLETEFSASGLSFRGILSDLSRGGVFVRTNNPFPEDTLVDLTIHLPGNMVSRIKGRVRRAIKTGQTIIKNGMGMEIVELDQNFAAFLDDILPVEEKVSKNSDAFTPLRAAESAAETRAKIEQDPKDDEIDTMISSLFRKRE